MKLIILKDLSFRIVDGEVFQEFSAYCNPRAILFSRRTLDRRIGELYSTEKERLKQILTVSSSKLNNNNTTFTVS